MHKVFALSGADHDWRSWRRCSRTRSRSTANRGPENVVARHDRENCGARETNEGVV